MKSNHPRFKKGHLKLKKSKILKLHWVNWQHLGKNPSALKHLNPQIIDSSMVGGKFIPWTILWFRVEDLGEDMFIMCKISKHEVAPTTN